MTYFHLDGTHGAYGSYGGYAQKHTLYWRWILASVLLVFTLTAVIVTYKTYASVESVAVQPRMPILAEPVKPVQPVVAPAIAPVDRSPELQAKLEAWAAGQSGSEWGFYIRSLDGEAIRAGVNADAQFDMASIYKLFVLKPLAAKVPAEAWSTNSIIGKSYQECVTVMLAKSDNPCAEALAGTIGWTTMQMQIRADGYGQTVINDTEKFVSSPADTGLLLERLYKGEGYDAKTKDIALSAMAQYKSSEAIRRSCDGCAVMNKTGDLAGAKHDAGIVVKDGKAYVVVIFSKNANWGKLVEAAALITSEL